MSFDEFSIFGFDWKLVAAFLSVAVLLIAAFVFLRRRRRRAPVASAREQAAAQLGLIGSVKGGASGSEEGGDGVVVQTISVEKSMKDSERALAKAKANGDEEDLAALYLIVGRGAISVGDRAKAEAQFRNAVLLAAKLKMDDLQAVARLELGDLAHQDGDLTTACEHWQMARGLFHVMKEDAAFDQVDKKMQGNGCPTDWVLNKF